MKIESLHIGSLMYNKIVAETHDYSDGYYLGESNPKPHHDFPLNSEGGPNREELEKILERPYYLVVPEKDPGRISMEELAQFYGAGVVSPDGLPEYGFLLSMAEKIYWVAEPRAWRPGQQDDHSFDKDCGKYAATFERLLHGRVLTEQEQDRLVAEIDSVMHGCHTEWLPIEEFIDGSAEEARNLLEAKFRWDGKEAGGLYRYYKENWYGKPSRDREYVVF